LLNLLTELPTLEEDECEEEERKQGENLLKNREEDRVDKEYNRASWRFEEIMEEDKKREERLKVERMVVEEKMVDKIFEAATKNVRGENDQVVP
jgi:hypothetical protein